MLPSNLDQDKLKVGEVLLINKPLDWTSFDVVNKLRYKLCNKLKVRKLKVGHAGTLDPKATGLLIICTGKYTKKITEFQDLVKTYTGTFYVGATRPSFDTETQIDQTYETDHITLEMIDQVIDSLTGDIQQMPPVYSAIKQEGKPIYRKAHRGEGDTVVMEARPVKIHSFELTRIAFPEVDFKIVCSKGTYIRAIAQDFGKMLGSGAYLQSLHRSAIGDFQSKDAWELDNLIDSLEAIQV